MNFFCNVKFYYIHHPTTIMLSTTIALLFDTYPIIYNRYNNSKAKTVSEMLSTVKCVDDHQLPRIEYEHRDRLEEIAAYNKFAVFSNPNKLEDGMDIVRLQMYLIEFLGESWDVRNDVTGDFVNIRMMQLLLRINSRYENVVLFMFDLMSENNEIFKKKIRELRGKINEFWKEQFIETSQTQIERRGEKIYFKGIVDKYRWLRVDTLKNVYGDDWTNWIWRILDIDEIGIYFYKTDPKLIEIENSKIPNTPLSIERSLGNFGNCPAYLN